MANPLKLIEKIREGQLDDTLQWLYHDDIKRQKNRYCDAIKKYTTIYSESDDISLVTAPGRCEISGNHTDHQNGCVLAAAVTVDILVIASKTSDNTIHMNSEGYPPMDIDITDLSLKPDEANSSLALVRGIASYFNQRQYIVGGANIYMISDVPKGSGLSSSACFEVAVGSMLNVMYNDGSIDAIEIARAGKFAENVYFMKPSGFMDQTACAVGGIVSIDFYDVNNPKIQRVDSSVMDNDYTLVVVNTGDSHANLSHMYASIPNEMKEIASFFSKEVLRELDEQQFYNSLSSLRGTVSDRAILRAHHFFSENKRVNEQIEALTNKNMPLFAELTRASGRSSSVYLQNIFPDDSLTERAIPLAIAISEMYLKDEGAYRVHGGGFAGTILSIVPEKMVDGYINRMEELFNKGCCYRLRIRPVGGYFVAK